MPDSLPKTLLTDLSSRTRLLKSTEVMSLLGISRNTLCAWVRAGRIPAFKVGKDYTFDPKELANFLATHRAA